MAFRLRKDTRKWFQDIRGSLNIEFDIYYFCLMAGLATNTKEDVVTTETTEIVDYFPGDYKGRIIVAAFLSSELKELGISMAEKAVLNEAINKLIDPNSQSYLSDIGMKEINKYSYGGYEKLKEWFAERPRTIEHFLPLYKRYLSEALKS